VTPVSPLSATSVEEVESATVKIYCIANCSMTSFKHLHRSRDELMLKSLRNLSSEFIIFDTSSDSADFETLILFGPTSLIGSLFMHFRPSLFMSR